MKKIILMTLTAIIFCSCSNDDVTLTYGTNVTVNPSSVTSSFEEWETGDINNFNGYILRTRVLMYNNEDALVYQASNFVDSYAKNSKFDFSLPAGTYTMITTTDMVRKNNDNITFKFWDLCDSTKLSTVKIIDAGYFDGAKKILGVDCKSMTISEGSNKIISNPSPAGALFLIWFKKIHAYSDVKQISFMTKKESYSTTFEDNTPQYNFKTDDYYYLDNIDPSDYPNSNGIISYSFQLATTQVPVKFQLDTSTKNYDWYETVINPVAGSEWIAYCDTQSSDSCFVANYKDVAAKQITRSKVVHSYFESQSKPTLYLKNFKKKN